MHGGEEGSVLTNTSHVIQKQAVDATLAMGHQADLAHCYKFHILQTNLQYTLFWDWGR
jgi:hypothetical protein